MNRLFTNVIFKLPASTLKTVRVLYSSGKYKLKLKYDTIKCLSDS